jgi:tetratricopeptide (TPR) repeat protein
MEWAELSDDLRLFGLLRQMLEQRVGGGATEFQGEAWMRAARLRDSLGGEAPRGLDMERFFEPAVKEAIEHVRREQRKAGSRSGVFGTHLDGALKAIEGPPERTSHQAPEGFDGEALWNQAHERANETMRRNLRWWKQRKVLGHSFRAIADDHDGDIAESTVRGGVSKAVRFLRKVQDELATEPWEAGRIDHEALHQAYLRQDLEGMAGELRRLAPYERDGALLNYEGVLQLWRGELDDARRTLRSALVFADRPQLRCIVANNLGNVDEECGALEDALYWFDRARKLDPRSPTPLLNLLGVVCLRADPDFEMHDRARALHYIDCITKLLSSRSLADDDRRYLLRRLADNPVFAPARRNTAWNRIRRWLKRADPIPAPRAEHVAADTPLSSSQVTP